MIDGIFERSPQPPGAEELLLLLRSQRGSRLLLGLVPPDVIPILTGTCPRPPLPPGFLVRDACQQQARQRASHSHAAKAAWLRTVDRRSLRSDRVGVGLLQQLDDLGLGA